MEPMDARPGSKRWQDWVSLLLGLWLFISPWVRQYPDEFPSATWNAYILGAAIVVCAALAMSMPKIWEEGVNFVLGVWLIVSPWVLGFSSYRNVTTSTVIVGVLVAVLATWSMAYDKDVMKWLRDHHVVP